MLGQIIIIMAGSSGNVDLYSGGRYRLPWRRSVIVSFSTRHIPAVHLKLLHGCFLSQPFPLNYSLSCPIIRCDTVPDLLIALLNNPQLKNKKEFEGSHTDLGLVDSALVTWSHTQSSITSLMLRDVWSTDSSTCHVIRVLLKPKPVLL